MRRIILILLTALLAVAVAEAATVPSVIARIPTGRGPCGLAAGYGSVWVASDTGTIARIDPSRNRVLRTVRVGRTACAVAVGGGAVWAIRYGADEVVRLDPKTLRLSRVPVGDGPEDVLVAAGSVWVTGHNDGTVTRIDLSTSRVTSTIRLPNEPGGLAFVDGSVWVGSEGEGTDVFRIDPAGETVTRVPLGVRAPAWFVAGATDPWVTTAKDGLVLRIDPATNRAVARLPVLGVAVEGATAPDGTLWIPSKQANTVTRIDPVRNRVVDVFGAGPGAYVALRAFGSMWVTSYAGTDVWRFRP